MLLFNTYYEDIAVDVEKAWDPASRIDIQAMSPENAAYVAGYTTKKIISKDISPDDRIPEFALMSRKPGIGKGYVDLLVKTIRRHNYSLAECLKEDQESISGWWLRYGGRLYPLDQYMRKNLVEELGGDQRTAAGRAMSARDSKKWLNPVKVVEDELERQNSGRKASSIIKRHWMKDYG